MRNLIAFCLTLLLLLPAVAADAAIYSYKDDKGRTVFVDDEQSIPAKYRGNTAVIREQRTPPAVEEGSGAAPAEPEGEVYIDRATQQQAREQARMLERKRASQTPVMVRGSRVMVPVEVAAGGKTANLMLILDPEAPNTVFHRAAVAGLRFQPGTNADIKLAGGRKLKAERVSLQHIDIGPFILQDFPVLLVTPQADGLAYDGQLGMDFLATHPYEVNYDAEMVYWKSLP